MEEIEILLISTFIAQDYLQHAGGGWIGNRASCFHSYLKPIDVGLKDVVAISYDASLTTKSRWWDRTMSGSQG